MCVALSERTAKTKLPIRYVDTHLCLKKPISMSTLHEYASVANISIAHTFMPDSVYCLLLPCSLLFQLFPPAFVLVKVVHAAAAVVVAVFAKVTVLVLVDGVAGLVVRM